MQIIFKSIAYLDVCKQIKAIMETIINLPIYLADNGLVIKKVKKTIWEKYLAFADSQSKNKTVWFLLSLIIQGVFFLPIPMVLMFYYNAPVAVVPITVLLYLGNIIVGMGGYGTRVLLAVSIVSIIINLSMLASFILLSS
jgi:hypothetical protein